MRTRLLSLADDIAPPLPAPCEALRVGAITHRNTAAKFWPRLIDEVHAAFPDCTSIELSAPTAECFDPVRLDPMAELARDVEDLAGRDLEDVIRETMAQLALYGPPSSVSIRLLVGQSERHAQTLPEDSVDVDTLLYLGAWLLEWAGIPHADWDAETLEGQIRARDVHRRRVYRVRFTATRALIKEGLFSQQLALYTTVQTND